MLTAKLELQPSNKSQYHGTTPTSTEITPTDNSIKQVTALVNNAATIGPAGDAGTLEVGVNVCT